MSEKPSDPTGHLGGPEEHEAHRNRALRALAPLTDDELSAMEGPLYLAQSYAKTPLDANETNVLRLVAEVRRLKAEAATVDRLRRAVAVVRCDLVESEVRPIGPDNENRLVVSLEVFDELNGILDVVFGRREGSPVYSDDDPETDKLALCGECEVLLLGVDGPGHTGTDGVTRCEKCELPYLRRIEAERLKAEPVKLNVEVTGHFTEPNP